MSAAFFHLFLVGEGRGQGLAVYPRLALSSWSLYMSSDDIVSACYFPSFPAWLPLLLSFEVLNLSALLGQK